MGTGPRRELHSFGDWAQGLGGSGLPVKNGMNSQAAAHGPRMGRTLAAVIYSMGRCLLLGKYLIVKK